MHCIDLFSGVGGMALGLHGIAATRAFCETDPFCQGVLCRRFGAAVVDVAHGTPPYHERPVFSNVAVTDFAAVVRPAIGPARIDMVCGGFPCQDISVCGRGEGIRRTEVDGRVQTNRSGLFYRAMDWVREFEPTFVFLENVPAVRSRGLGQVLSELTSLNYDCKWGLVSALDVGKPHIRERWFLLACARAEPSRPAKRARAETCTRPKDGAAPSPVTERAAAGPHYNKVCMALGNAVVPAQAAHALAILCGFRDADALRDELSSAPRSQGVASCLYDAFRRTWRAGCGDWTRACTGTIAGYGCATTGDDGEVRIAVCSPWARISPRGMRLWPTPTRVSRPAEGPARQLRALAVAGDISWETACIYHFYKCVCRSHGALPEWDGAGSETHVQAHDRMKGEDFANRRFVRNPKFLLWLMGFPGNHFDE